MGRFVPQQWLTEKAITATLLGMLVFNLVMQFVSVSTEGVSLKEEYRQFSVSACLGIAGLVFITLLSYRLGRFGALKHVGVRDNPNHPFGTATPQEIAAKILP